MVLAQKQAGKGWNKINTQIETSAETSGYYYFSLQSCKEPSLETGQTGLRTLDTHR